MQQPVKERIAKLREEIAQIREANHQYLYGGKKSPATAPDHERRLQRLKEILVELASLTEWREP
jgi:DNA-binding MurR/RpiR family transcriptional regulator